MVPRVILLHLFVQELVVYSDLELLELGASEHTNKIFLAILGFWVRVDTEVRNALRLLFELMELSELLHCSLTLA